MLFRSKGGDSSFVNSIPFDVDSNTPFVFGNDLGDDFGDVVVGVEEGEEDSLLFDSANLLKDSNNLLSNLNFSFSCITLSILRTF